MLDFYDSLMFTHGRQRRLHAWLLLLILSLVFDTATGQTSDEGTAGRSANGLKALYEFNEGSGTVVRDVSGASPRLNLNIPASEKIAWAKGKLSLLEPTQLRTSKPATRLNEAIRRSNALTVEAWIEPSLPNQTGPARIVSLSRNGTERNVTLGQDGDRYDVRLRTLSTSGNGIPSLASPKNSVQTTLTHLVYTRDRSGQARLFINGRESSHKAIPGSTYNWHGQFRLALGNEFGGNRPWLGTYHLVAIYSRALKSHEVTNHFNAGPEAETPTQTHGSPLTSNETLFVEKIAPLLVDRCFECHDTATAKGDLDLSRKQRAFAGSSSGEVLVPGKALESYLWESVATDEMPADRTPLSQEEKEWVKSWIDGGASWPIEVIDPAAFVHQNTARENWAQRLTVPEYIASVRSTVGVDITTEARETLPRDLRADGFSNTAYNLNVDLAHVNAYAQLAAKIVARMDITAFAERFSKSTLLTDKNMRALIQKMGKWILRAPLEAHETDLYRGISTTVASAGGDFEDAVQLILEAMLQSPRFIYRIENQKGDGSRWPISDHELAVRMSYILWGTAPDAALIQVAESGTLSAPENLDTQIARLLRDRRAVDRSRLFISEWLNLNRLNSMQPNRDHFPTWDTQLAHDMRDETLLFFEELAWRQRRPLTDLFDAQFTFASTKLAGHYGLSARTPGIQRYDLRETPGRGGLLTHGSVLTVGGDEASMVSRGLFVLHDLLRGVVNDPPPCVDTTPTPTKAGVTQRTIAEERIANAQCGGCHAKFEPLAFGLEKFDGIGAYHEKDEHGNRLRDDGNILFPGTAQPVEYQNSKELMKLLANSDRIKESLTWKLTQFALGRPLGFEDANLVQQIHEQAQQNGGTYQALITEIVKSDLVLTMNTETSE